MFVPLDTGVFDRLVVWLLATPPTHCTNVVRYGGCLPVVCVNSIRWGFVNNISHYTYNTVQTHMGIQVFGSNEKGIELPHCHQYTSFGNQNVCVLHETMKFNSVHRWINGYTTNVKCTTNHQLSKEAGTGAGGQPRDK